MRSRLVYTSRIDKLRVLWFTNANHSGELAGVIPQLFSPNLAILTGEEVLPRWLIVVPYFALRQPSFRGTKLPQRSKEPSFGAAPSRELIT
jgi:hypothetical protein